MPRVARVDLVLATLTGITAVGASFIVTRLTREFIVLAVDRMLVTLTPGPVIAFVIQRFGKTGHLLHQLPAGALTIGAVALLGLTGLIIARQTHSRPTGAVVAGYLTWLFTVVLTGVPVHSLAPGVAVLVVVWATANPRADLEYVDAERRSILRGVAGATGTFALGGVSYVLYGRPPPPPELPGGNSISTEMVAMAADQSLDIPGIEPLVSDNFYEVDINPAANPTVSADDWSLSVTGAVETDLELSYAALTGMERDNRFLTLRCVSDEINGDLMDNAVWTGVPASTILDRATPKSGCECVMLHAADGYYEEFPLAALEPGLIAYGMNGRALPRRHGYPVRALVPGHWGEVNVKWLTTIEVLDKEAVGFWEQRGWHGTGPVTTVAKLHAVNHIDDGHVVVGGHAYAGTRGIQRVEVSTDDGDTWSTAELSQPLPGDDVWRQWRYEYQYDTAHTVIVRAVDGTGAVQPREHREPYPSGATGWVTREIP